MIGVAALSAELPARTRRNQKIAKKTRIYIQKGKWHRSGNQGGIHESRDPVRRKRYPPATLYAGPSQTADARWHKAGPGTATQMAAAAWCSSGLCHDGSSWALDS